MKVALISGGSRGIGAAAAEKFARSGYSVIINYNNSEQQAKALQSRLLIEGCDVHLFRADVSRVAEVEAMFGYVGKYFKHLDVLVNNAGIAQTRQLQDVTEADYDGIMSVNAKGAFFCCKYALPYLTKCNGTILNVASVWGIRGASCESVYSMSKHALLGLTRSLALELAETVSVNALCPPLVLTDMTANYSQTEIADFCRETGTRVYTSNQVADAVYSLATSGQNGVIADLT